MKSHLHHKVMGTRPFPRPGLSFPLTMAMLMEISPLLNRTPVCVFWDRPTDLAESWLCREGPGRRGGVIFWGAKKGRVEKPPIGANAGPGGGEPTGVQGSPVCVCLRARHTTVTISSTRHFPGYSLRARHCCRHKPDKVPALMELVC